MKIVAINGSPKGKASNSNVMVSALLKGAREAGAETENIFLTDNQINYCRGCHVCWTKGPGQCVINDDMLKVLSFLGGADVIIFASPVYFENISGMLKVFMDRMTMIGSPHSQDNTKKDTQNEKDSEARVPGLIMVSNCGFPDRSEFEVTSLWIRRVAQKMNMELIGEIYATQGKLLTNSADELQFVVSSYLKLLEKAGKEIASEKKLSATTSNLLKETNSEFNNVNKGL